MGEDTNMWGDLRRWIRRAGEVSLRGLMRDVMEQRAVLAEDAGLRLLDMALAFVLEHPAVTSAIIGPRTMDQLEDQLGASDVKLTDAVLDRIDEIVPPGVNLNPADAGWQPP